MSLVEVKEFLQEMLMEVMEMKKKNRFNVTPLPRTEGLREKKLMEFIAEYVDLNDDDLLLVASYILYTYTRPSPDGPVGVPILLIDGDHGGGKTRFLEVVGPLCDAPFITNAACPARVLSQVLSRGFCTLIMDEYTDPVVEVIKNLRYRPAIISAVRHHKALLRPYMNVRKITMKGTKNSKFVDLPDDFEVELQRMRDCITGF